jgi:2,2-dialkylglycine decarboxylase (pyruvate)
MATAYQDRVLTRASGSTITDADGNTLIDLEAGQICSILGHNHPTLVRRIVEQTQTMLHHGTGFLSARVFEAAEKLARVTPGALKKSIFVSTGAEANECAFRIAKTCTGRNGIVGFHRGYAGLTLATMAVGGSARDTSLTVPGALKILTPHCRECPVGRAYPGCDYLCLATSEEFLRAHCADGIAAFIVEPILSSGGMIFPPPGYLRQLRDLATRLGALLIADEAQTGMGRTGTWFGTESEGVVPDILVFSKGVGGGFPAAGVIVTDEVADGILGRFGNFSSHQSDPVAAAAIAAVIDVIEEEDLLARAVAAGKRLLDGLQVLRDRHGLFVNVRGRGLMIGVDVSPLPEQGMSAEQVGTAFEYLCREAGVHLKSIWGGRIFRILPALTITDEEVDTVLGVFERVTLKVLGGEARGLHVGATNPFTRRLEEARSQGSALKRIARKAWETSPAEIYERVARILGSGS